MLSRDEKENTTKQNIKISCGFNIMRLANQYKFILQKTERVQTPPTPLYWSVIARPSTTQHIQCVFFSSLVCEVKERIVHIERIDVNWAERTQWNEQKSNKKKKKKKHTTINQQTNQQPHSRKKSEEEMKRNNKLMKFSTINLFCCVTMHT